MKSMLRKSVTLSLACLMAVLWVASGLQAKVFSPETATLENGMQVVVIPNHRAPIVSHMVWYKVGSADEPRGVSGIAHFLEHLMFKGTKTVKPGEFSEIVSRLGGNDNAFTARDFTAYHQTISKDALEEMMRLEADRMVNLTLDPEEVYPELDVVLEERRSRIDNNPGARMSEEAVAALYMAYPYRIPIIGWKSELEALTREDALEFYETWYAPNNAVLAIAGDVTMAEVLPLAKKYYGPIPSRPVPDRVALRGVEPPHESARSVKMVSDQVGQASLSKIYIAPSKSYGASEHALPLQVLADILGGGSTSRVYRSLVVDQKIASSAGSWYQDESMGPTTFRFYGSPRTGKTLDDIDAAIDREVEKLLKDGVSDEEVAVSIKRMTAAAAFARDDATYPARIFGSALATGGTVEDIEEWPERIHKVNPAAVLAAAKYVLRPENSITTKLVPGKKGNGQ